MLEQRPLAFQFKNPREFLRAYIDYRKVKSNDYSLRRLARDVGLKSPGFLSDVISGKRAFSPALTQKLDKVIGFTPDEKKYFIYQNFSKEASTDQSVKQDFVGLNATPVILQNFDLDMFTTIKDWYHLAILELTESSDFNPSGEWISKKLGNKIEPFTAEFALLRLQKVGLVSLKNGKYTKTQQDIFIGKNIPSATIKDHHRQCLALAKHSLEHQDIMSREFTGTTIAIKPEDFDRLRKLIKSFNQDLHRLASHEDASEVVRINIQAFLLTEENPKDKTTSPCQAG